LALLTAVGKRLPSSRPLSWPPSSGGWAARWSVCSSGKPGVEPQDRQSSTTGWARGFAAVGAGGRPDPSHCSRGPATGGWAGITAAPARNITGKRPARCLWGAAHAPPHTGLAYLWDVESQSDRLLQDRAERWSSL